VWRAEGGLGRGGGGGAGGGGGGGGGEGSIDAYKKLSVLRETFEKLIDAVANIGKAEKGAR